MDLKGHTDKICNHYIKIWESIPTVRLWHKGPVYELPEEFRVLEFGPSKTRNMWTYATCGMSSPMDTSPLELHVFAPEKNEELVELLTILSHYHRKGSLLGCEHTINFGRPWWPNSYCEYGLISLPYLDGPLLEWMDSKEKKIRFLWVIPITKKEVEYKKQFGLDALEQEFEKMKINYLDPYRVSII